MDDSYTYSLQMICAPVFRHFKAQPGHAFDLDITQYRINKRRMIDLYVRFSLRNLYGEARNIRTSLTEEGFLTIQMD